MTLDHKDENSQAFTPEDIDKGLFEPFMAALYKLQSEAKYPLDIRIWTDGYCRIVSWSTVFDKETPHYELIEEGQFVDEWINGTAADGSSVDYRASDLEDPEFCDSNGIEYDAAARKWSVKSH